MKYFRGDVLILVIVVATLVSCEEDTQRSTASPSDTSQSVILPAGQAGRDEFARRVTETGQGVIRAHANGETLIVESEAFDESINRRHFRQIILGGTGKTSEDTDGKLCGLGFSELRLVGPTKTEKKLIPCG
jgi:hypothetical protein